VNVHPGTLPGALFSAALRYGDRPAIIDGETTLGFRALTLLVEDAARAFMALGIARGDRVAIWAPNGWAWEIVALGAQLAGGVLVPLNTRFKGREAAALLAKTRARVLVIQNEFLGIDYLAQLRDGGMNFPEEIGPVIGLGAAVPPEAMRWTAFLARAFSIPRDNLLTRAQSLTPDDFSDIIFTSGTTGRPKGVLATHGQTLRVFRTWSELAGLGESDRYLVVNPYFHTFGYKAGWLACLLTGATCHPHAVFDATTVLRHIERDRITVLPGAPTLYQSLLDHPDRSRFDLSSLRLAVTGAATIPITLVKRMRDELGFRTVLTAYGLTEATGVVTMCRRDDELETIAHTSGRAIPGVEVRVAAPAGEPGEVRVRGYNVMPGYFEDRQESEAALDEEGWLRTGDIGVLDERGNLRITDRLKDMYIVGGFNAYPAEIEDLLAEHRAIRRVAVVGAPDSRMGEVGVAFVVLRDGAKTTPDEIIAWARGRMANYKVPRRVEIVGELPQNAVGKVLKHVLRARAVEAL
jgi:acyl-CoA synthetase (AMP-forming)/AMP-acid ligase II